MALLADSSADVNSNLVTGVGTQTVTYTVPANVYVKVESVVATITNGAAASVHPELTIRDTSGVVIARTRQGRAIPAGDDGTATFALRLADDGAGADDDGGGGATTTLGSSTDGGSALSGVAGRKGSTKFVLATAGTLTELHALVGTPSAAGGNTTMVLHIYSDSAGSPNTRLAYTSPITVHGQTPAAVVEISQSGFAVALAAGNYWLGISFTDTLGDVRHGSGSLDFKGILAGAAVSPPSDPWGVSDFGGDRNLNVWATVSV